MRYHDRTVRWLSFPPRGGQVTGLRSHSYEAAQLDTNPGLLILSPVLSAL